MPARLLRDSQLLMLKFRNTEQDRKSTRLNSSHLVISYAVFCLKKKNNYETQTAWLFDDASTAKTAANKPWHQAMPPESSYVISSQLLGELAAIVSSLRA